MLEGFAELGEVRELDEAFVARAVAEFAPVLQGRDHDDVPRLARPHARAPRGAQGRQAPAESDRRCGAGVGRPLSVAPACGHASTRRVATNGCGSRDARVANAHARLTSAPSRRRSLTGLRRKNRALAPVGQAASTPPPHVRSVCRRGPGRVFRRGALPWTSVELAAPRLRSHMTSASRGRGTVATRSGYLRPPPLSPRSEV